MNASRILSRYRRSTTRFSARAILCGAALLCFFSAAGQDKESLRRERDKITEEIKYTNRLLEEAKKSRSKLEGELGLINKKITLREDLIRSINKEVKLYNRRIENNRREIEMLESKLELLKERYAELVRLAYRTGRVRDRLMYIFASEDFFQAIRRVRYLRKMAEIRKDQSINIMQTRNELEKVNEDLNEAIAQKNQILEEEQSEKQALNDDLRKQQQAVKGLKSQERELLATLKKQERQREKLNKEIQRIIEAEIRASKKDNAGVFELTPEAAALSADFESNRGKLPWPVERGVIVSNFGPNPHPVLAGITIPNNGIDIATGKDAQVRAIFEGTVSAVFSIPGAGKNVIVNHGGYRSVYSNLKEVYVEKGQRLSAKESIGVVLTDEVDGKTEAHIEIWKVGQNGTTKEDPAKWIFRR
jgi:septal ring factor EnvC (AmiA/AmiB activator)